MGINKYNSEGYYDPTVYEALSNIEKEEKAARRVYRPLVYICSPYAGDIERNVHPGGAGTCSFHGNGAAYEVRTGVGVWQRHICGYAGRD